MAAMAEMADAKAPTETGPALRVVVQRCESAELLLDNVALWAQMGKGLIAYVGFYGEAEAKALEQAARTILHLKLCPGAWGADNSAAAAGSAGGYSIAELCAMGVAAGVMVVPQANLTSSITGVKSINHRSVFSKERSQVLYGDFIRTLRRCAWEAVHPPQRNAGPKKAKGAPVPPSEYFRTGAFAGQFSAYDGDGIPTHDAEGEALGKGKRKKLERLWRQQEEKYARYMAKGGDAAGQEGADQDAMDDNGEGSECAGSSVDAGENDDASGDGGGDGGCAPEPVANQHEPGDDRVARVIAGTFANRQGMRVHAECGPFFHTFTY